MVEKGLNPTSSFYLSKQWLLTRRFSILALGLFIGMLIIWSIDGCSVTTTIKKWQNKRALKLNNPNFAPFTYNLTHNSSSIHTPTPPLDDDHVFLVTHLSPEPEPEPGAEPELSISHSIAPLAAPLDNHQNLDWISIELEPNYTSNLLSRWLAHGGEPCKDSQTVQISIPGLDDQSSLVELSTGDVHEFAIQALDEEGKPRCLGGDYFEIDLSGESWKSRPPITDFGNGSYSLKLQVHPDFAGEYNFTIVLLFRHFQGLRFSPARFVYWKELQQIRINFVKTTSQLPELSICKKSDFDRDLWSGRWTRLGKNDQCEIDYDGRYRCLKPDFLCQTPWCNGSLGSLESNGWVYSAHCSFQIFSSDSAWECLQNRWIFFWGDSNHVDSIRNLLNFVLGLTEIKSVPRRFDMNFTNPTNPSQSVRITSIFNGHWNETKNYEGLNSLQNEEFRHLLKRYFSGEIVPDTMIINSGLHDGVHWKNIRRFINGAHYAINFWKEVIESIKAKGIEAPRVIYRTTIATGGYARSLAFNPNKMEVFNGVMLDKLKSSGILSSAIDDFDMTFPWHYDNRCNDGVHYGRAPAKLKWRDGEIGHQYFVDVMLGHVVLNALCARKTVN